MSSVEPAPNLALAGGERGGQALLSSEGTVLAADDGLAVLLGRPRHELVGHAAAEVLSHLSPGLTQLLERVRAGGEPVLAQDVYAEASPNERWLLSLIPIRSRMGRQLGIDLELRPWAMASYEEPALPPEATTLVASLRGELGASDEPYRAIFNQTDVGLILVGPQGGLLAVNPGFCAIVGYSADEIKAARPQDLAHPDDLAADHEQIRQLLAGEAAPAIEKRFVRRDGTIAWTRVSRSLVRGPEGDVRFGLVVVHDISAEKAMQHAAEQAATRAVALLSLTAALSRAITPERVGEAVLDEACGIFGAAAGVITLLDTAQDALCILMSQGYPEELLRPWERIPLTVATPLSDAARRGEPVFLGSPEASARTYPHLNRASPTPEPRAWVALPLKLDQQLIGAMGLSFHAPRDFNDDERTYLMTMAGLCAQALERARLYTAEREALQAADEALAMLDLVVDSAPIGMAYLDRDFRYRRINPRLAAMNGLPVAAHLGQRAGDLFPRLAPIWESHWRQVITTGEPVPNTVLSAALPDGSVTHAQISYYPVRVGAGPVLGIGIIVNDITQQRQAEEERARLLSSEQVARAAAQAAQANAEAAVQLRDAFLSIAAHELKTPLTSLLGQAQLLERRLAKEGLLSEQNARSMQVVMGQTRRLGHLITDLLDGAHLELGQLSIKRRPVELVRLVRQFVEEFQPTSPGNTITLALDQAPIQVLADPVRMEQVIQNLLSNAVKYSPRGSTVHVELRVSEQHALLSIRDQGVGIAPEAIPHLFERFYRVDSPETASVSGVGVGLYVVREIVQLHGGAVRVVSAPGQGSTFTVELPLEAWG